MQFLKAYLSLSTCYDRAGIIQRTLLPVMIMSFVVGLIWALWIAPLDVQQGEGYRIIYVHVPCAFLSLSLYLVMGLMGLIFLVWGIKVTAVLVHCLAKVGALFAVLALITGAVWGKPMWGTWWVWDARLTSTLILFFLYLGVLVLHNTLGWHQSRDKACALLAIIGTINIPIIHYSVYWWNTLHQGATLARFGAPLIAFSMLRPLLFMLGCFMLYTLVILCMLLRQSIAKREAHTQWLHQRRVQNVV